LGMLQVSAASTLLSSRERGKFPFGIGFVQEAGFKTSEDCPVLQSLSFKPTLGSNALVTQIREKLKQQDRQVVSELDGEG
jgi:hypothetical protein